ncbi:thioredoxin reductase [Synergistales bacterium]|nr:thioredoxin reductase [Synergistales bacterium]
MEKRELVIIGAGPAGMSAAIYGRRAGLDVLLLEKGATGGQINITDEIENWPGVQHATGPELGDMLRDHALKFKTEIRFCDVKKVELRGDAKVIITDKGDIEAEAVILATGAYFRRLGCPGEDSHIGQGVSYCATCDGAFFEDLEVAVIGGGNTAVEEGAYLTKFATKVYIIHRRDEFRADRAAIERAMSNPKIVPIWNSVVESIEGNGPVDHLVLKNVKTNEVSNLEVSGVFVFVGQSPHDECFKGLVKSSKAGWVIVNEHMETSVEGIFAAGDVLDKHLRQVITAAADGAIAAMSASAYVDEQIHLRSTLLEPESVTAFFYSSPDATQSHLSNEVEKLSKEKGKKIPIVDGYKNSRIVEKLKIELPSVVEIKKGAVSKVTKVVTEADIAKALS